MSQAIQEAILACNWSPSSFFIYSDNVFATLIYYSHIGVIGIALFFGLFVYLNRSNEITNRLLFLITLTLSLWLFSDLVLWANEVPKYVMFFWGLEIIIEPLIYILSLYFFYSFVDKKDISWKKRLFIFGLTAPTLILASSNYALSGFDLTNCDRVAIEGILPKYGYLLEVVIILWIVKIAFNRYRNALDSQNRKRIFITAFGIVFFLFSFSLGNIAEVITENWYIGQIGYIGAPLFIALLCYEIVKFKEFKVKVLSSQVLVASIWFLTFSILFIRKIENVRMVVAATLALFSILGIYLIRSVKREVEQREKIEKLAKDLEAANQKLKELDEMKSEFLSLASHQIRSPLTAMKGYSSMLLEGDYGEISIRAKEAVRAIFASSQNLITIVNDFLDISRIEQGRMIYKKEEFDMIKSVHEVVTSLMPNIQKSGLEFIVDVPKHFEAKVRGDEGKIKQVISNLIDNAVKYTIRGSITISAHVENGKVRIEIKDTGMGLDQADISRLFTKFVRMKDAYRTNVTGTGLGLFIAKRMIEAHGGTIGAQSKGKETGSTFWFELPIVN